MLYNDYIAIQETIIYKISPEVLYTSNKRIRSSIDMNNPTSHPKITDIDAKIEDYDVFL